MKRLEEIKKAFSSKYRPYAISDTEIQLVNMGRELIAEVERLRRIEDVARSWATAKKYAVYIRKISEMQDVLEANPRPED